MTMLGVATGARDANAGKELVPKFTAIAESGAQFVRLSAQWDRVEPNIGDAYNWKPVDPIVDICEKLGMGLILECASRDNAVYAKGMPARYIKFITAVAQRYQGRIMATATINEPNHEKVDPVPSAENYTDLILKPAYESVKKVAPGLTVLTGGLGGASNDAGMGDSSDFLVQMYEAGAKGYFDALAYHPYTHPQSWLESLKAQKDGAWRMHKSRIAMRENGDAAKQIWITEYGSPTGGSRTKVSRPVQAAQLKEVVEWVRTKPWCGPFAWFCWSDDPQQDPLNYGDFMGLVDSTGTPKASYNTFKKLAASFD